MKKLFIGIGLILFIAVSGAALAYFQPWSEFPPSEMNRTFLAKERVHHFRIWTNSTPRGLSEKAILPIPGPEPAPP